MEKIYITVEVRPGVFKTETQLVQKELKEDRLFELRCKGVNCH